MHIQVYLHHVRNIERVCVCAVKGKGHILQNIIYISQLPSTASKLKGS